MSSIDKLTSESDFSVIKGKNDGNVLPLSINEHCFAKEGVKDFALLFEVSDKFVIVKN